MTILIIEDDQLMQALLRTWLLKWDHEVVAVASADAVAEISGGCEFDVALTNWTLTAISTPKLYSLIRQQSNYHYIIAYSSGDSEIDFIASTDAGADDVMSSPLNPAQLRVRILAAERLLNLQRAFAAQSAEEKSLKEKLDFEHRALQAELEAASVLQLSLLPTVSDIHPKFSLDWLVLPNSFLAGDNLNYFMMQDRYLIFYHLDVAGHGIASALLSVTLNQLLSPQPGSPMVRFDPQLEVKRIVPPMEVVSELNRRFQPQGDGYFTMIYAVMDTHNREICLCQAGHPSPIKFHADGSSSQVGDGGFPVGLWPDMAYEETTTTLLPGERLLLYSDGVLACLNAVGCPYSLAQLEDVVKRNSSESIQHVLEAVKSELQIWSEGRGFPDDISMLILESK